MQRCYIDTPNGQALLQASKMHSYSLIFFIVILKSKLNGYFLHITSSVQYLLEITLSCKCNFSSITFEILALYATVIKVQGYY